MSIQLDCHNFVFMIKNVILFLSGIFLLSSCDPHGAEEGLTLPQMKFGFRVSPDTTYIKLGDTVTISGAIPNPLENGVRITDGKAIIETAMGYREEIPIVNVDGESNLVDEYLDIYTTIGGVEIGFADNPGLVRWFYAVPDGDSIKLEIKIIPHKVGSYSISLYSSFFEGSQGKTRTQSIFDVENNHFDELMKIPGSEELGPGDYGYDNAYVFAVYE